MKIFIRSAVSALLRALDGAIEKITARWPGLSAEWNDRALARVRHIGFTVHHVGRNGPVCIRLQTPNEVTRYRAQTFSTKEPETLEWIDQYGGEGAFYDIGANVGLYSLYYSKVHPGTTFAFEPSTLNLGLLTTNIAQNGMSSRIIVVPVPITDYNQTAAFRMSMLDEGGAMSTFGRDYGHDGKRLDSMLEFEVPGLSLDFVVEHGIVGEAPTIMKIDVDGIEHLILRGARNLLSTPTLKTVLIEVNDSFTVLAQEVSRLLGAAGFVLRERRQSDMFSEGKFAATYNQIWVR